MISQSKRSLSIELNEYFDILGQSPCTKGAFSKARYRVLWLFFRDWHRHLVDLVYADPRSLYTWKGYFLKAVDGSSIYLFKDVEVEKEFGGQSNQHGRIPMARAGIELDVLNGYCTQAQLQSYSEGEVVFKELYNYRWGDETKFDQIKNKLQIEVFSGHKPPAIYQDFFATVIASNLHNLICKECTQELEQINANRETSVAINQNVSIGLLKPRLLILFMAQKPDTIFNELKNLFLRHLEPIRPGRKYPRAKTIRRLKGKYQTFKNYRRAA